MIADTILIRIHEEVRQLRIELEDLRDKLAATQQALESVLETPCPHCGEES